MNDDMLVNPREIRVVGPGINEDGTASDQRIEWEEQREAKKKNNFKRAQMRAFISSLYGSDMTIAAIIEQTQEEFDLEKPLTVGQVRHHIDTQIDYWKQEGLKNIDHKRALHLQNIRHIEELATTAYFISMQGRTVQNYEKQIESAKSKKTKEQQRERAFEEKTETKNLLDEALWDSAGNLNSQPKEEEIGEAGEGDLEAHLQVVSQKIKEYNRYESNAAGDKEFLKIMLECAKERASVWNLYVKDTFEDAPDREFARMSDNDKTARIGTILQAAQQRLVPDTNLLAPAAPLYGGKEAYDQQRILDKAEEDKGKAK